MARFRPKILAFAGSARSGSLNGRLAALATRMVAQREADATLISLADYQMPLYDGDLEKETGIPANARRLRDQMITHQGIFIASPEYNQSVTPLLKNCLDWVSRIRPEGPGAASPWTGRIFALGSASPGYFAGVRSLMHLRHVLSVALGCTVIPEQVSVPSAGSAFADDGGFVEERLTRQLEAVVDRLVEESSRYA